MTLWTFLAIFFGGAFLLEAYKTHRKSKLKAGQSSELAAVKTELDALKAENQAMKARIQTLEAIVTDGRFDLDQEFRKLG
ncbi:conserved hypothetical protein [Ferrimonas balearica DSM 9799]|uniref:Phage shock protein B n=1 Tax=Ferrimonas balearica (strain DSM 9799 / CCM 4581 / KCTC 23876 / PAT) TaxID=550540 RepID=E1SQG5_FERBD|nr:hypothetical protein [Ferrimonas balearica]ADN74777.1 conserved hypothetical protein [Ferrimonas balearica DSM 9799]MBW3140582.1 hypothetical protein [Ferrimonas balearica]MBW3165441.1 hypothetical protein [Ferrimonas balearica]MBY5981348.1 hypothetical protein [Ferrimonas balearica]MBY6107615.1 hypothetical protein [Ferrimonas balearica]